MSASKLVQLLKEKNLTVSTAESCTAGLISSKISSISGASEVLNGGIVCYTNMVKKRIVGVRRTTLKKYGAVSEETAIEMAKCVRKQLRTDWSIAITGLVGPNGDGSETPVGTVWIALSTNKKVITKKILVDGTRLKNQNTAASEAILFLIENLQ